MKLTIIICILFFLGCNLEQHKPFNIVRDEYGNITIKEYKTNVEGQIFVESFDSLGVKTYEYYKRGNQYDSIVKTFNGGALNKIIKLNEHGDSIDFVTVYDSNGLIKETYTLIDWTAEGWHIFYDEAGDTTLINYAVNGIVHYINEKKYINGQQTWVESFVPLINFEQDTVFAGESITGILDLPLPSTDFNLDDFRLSFYESMDSIVFNHPIDFVNYRFLEEDNEETTIPSKITLFSEKEIKKVLMVQVVRSIAGVKQKYPFVKKKVVFL
jgi:hypothetical protein